MILPVVLGFAAATFFVVIFLGSHYGMSLGRYMHRRREIAKLIKQLDSFCCIWKFYDQDSQMEGYN